ncbi:UDP-N-acetylenolpyruvoylglucosamine reductase [Mycolicibacillus koreensis]|uniref:UDP-N-acetylenolpyruvoylglucosamine reductase n=2 Tax=Mycolicibacillus koreensis TaxID=1069220 RepID=A0AA91SQD5_9MYCO|nr:UDP-N-acetylenolpyruvoylglucosamine reductase [Mycolicibacillus koreensis]
MFCALTTIATGGPAARYVEAASTAAVVDAVRAADESGDELLILGGGSNLLVADAGVDAVTVAVRTRGIDRRGDLVTVAAGHRWDDVVAELLADGRGQLAPLSGIPGTAGATPIQNVGAYGAAIADTLEGVRVYDRDRGEVRDIPAAACGLGNRTSVFKHADRHVVLAVTLRLPRTAAVPVAYAQLAAALGVPLGASAPARRVRAAVLALRASKGMVLDRADHDTWSAGSFFVNPVLAAGEAPAGCPTYPAGSGRVKIPAAWLIEAAGFTKGYPGAAAPARLSTKHALALTNRGAATSSDVLALARRVRDGVRDAFGITLVPEPVLVGCTLGDPAANRSGQQRTAGGRPQ